MLNSNLNRKTYFGLSRNFITGEAVAREAVRRCSSTSRIEVEDKGWSDDGLGWDVAEIKRDFGLEFDGWEKVCRHLDYFI